MNSIGVTKKKPSKVLKIIEIPLNRRYEPLYVRSPDHHHYDSNFEKLNPIQEQKNNRYNPTTTVMCNNMIGRNSGKKYEKNRGSIEQVCKQRIETYQKIQHTSINIPSSKQYHSPYSVKRKIINISRLGKPTYLRERLMSQRKSGSIRLDSLLDSQLSIKAAVPTIQTARQLINKGQNRKSLLLIKKILCNEPENYEALYLEGLNWYKINNNDKALASLQKLTTLNPQFSYSCYIIKALCYSKKNQYGISIKALQDCQQYFPQCSQGYYYQAKIYEKQNNHSKAHEIFLKAYSLNKFNNQILYSLACSYILREQQSVAIQIINKLIYHYQQIRGYCLKIHILLKLYKYQEIVETFNAFENCIQTNKIKLSNAQKAEIHYMVGYAHYKQNNFNKAWMILEEVSTTKENHLAIVKLMLIIKIIQRDFYKAWHILETSLNNYQLIELQILVKFVQGVINLMKKNFDEAIILFNNLKHYDESKDQFICCILKIYHMFLAYGYFYTGQFILVKLQIVKQINLGVQQPFKVGLSYNLSLCQGLISYNTDQLDQAILHFQDAAKLCPNKLQPQFSLAILNIGLALRQNYLTNQRKQQAQLNGHIRKIREHFNNCTIISESLNNSSVANLYYHISVFYGYIGIWNQALIMVQEAIDRSQQHYWRYFYLRGVILGCIHSFQEAINDASIAISLSKGRKSNCFLLRSKCLQIQGEGNKAFKDLQDYITLNPEDQQIHKYAGQLLFENGAFQDALLAFNHDVIEHKWQNLDIFLTKAKTNFLLGKFHLAAQDILQANLLYSQPQPLMIIDTETLIILQTLVQKSKSYLDIRNNLQLLFDYGLKTGFIFKNNDYYTFLAVCDLYEGRYKESIEQFQQAITIKKQLTVNQFDFINNQKFIHSLEYKELSYYTDQMHFNIVICALLMRDIDLARKNCELITVNDGQPYSDALTKFKQFVNGQIHNLQKEEVYPNRNKFSNYLDKVQIVSPLSIDSIKLTLCIPFPKVQPPVIFPEFDKQLLNRFSIQDVDIKPEAPWIIREDNAIKFTDKMQKFSNLNLDESQISLSEQPLLEIDQSHLNLNSLKKLRKSINNGFYLNKQVQDKLKKIIHK